MSKPTDSLPHSDQCEKGLLGSFIHSPDKVYDKCQFRNVNEKWFYHPDHGKFFLGMCEMKKHGMFASWQEQKEKHLDYLIPVTQYCLDHATRLNIATSNLSEVVTGFYTTVNTAAGVDHYIDTLQKKWAHRSARIEWMQLGEKINQSVDLDTLHSAIAGPFVEAKELCQQSDPKDHHKESLLAFVDEVEAMHNGTQKADLFPFGIPDLDRQVGGAQRGEVIVILGSTSTGKSLNSQHFLQTNVFEHNRKGEVYSIEMPIKQYLRRITASMGNISLNSLKNGQFTKAEFQSFGNTIARIDAAKIGIHDLTRNRMTVDSIEASMRRVKKNKGMDIVIIDYLQLIKPSKGKVDSRRDQDLSAISSNFKRLAMELNLVAVLVAQGNEKGTVFDASQVESDADWVFSMIPAKKKFNGIERITGTDGVWLSKAREGERGKRFDVVMRGATATLDFQPNI